MGLTTRSCRLGGTTSARMKRWQLSRSTVVCVIGLPAFADGPALCRKRSTWSTPPSHCLPPTTSIEQRQNSPCHCLFNTLTPPIVGGRFRKGQAPSPNAYVCDYNRHHDSGDLLGPDLSLVLYRQASAGTRPHRA